MGLTLAEKVLAAKAHREAVEPGQIIVADVDLAIAQDGTGPLAVEQIRELGPERLEVPEAVFFIDHAAPSPRAELSDAHAILREFCRESGATLSDVEMGVCHQRVIARRRNSPAHQSPRWIVSRDAALSPL